MSIFLTSYETLCYKLKQFKIVKTIYYSEKKILKIKLNSLKNKKIKALYVIALASYILFFLFIVIIN